MRIQYIATHVQPQSTLNPNPHTQTHLARSFFFLIYDLIITDGLTNGSTDKASYKVVTENTLGKSKFNKAGYTAIQSRTAGQEQ